MASAAGDCDWILCERTVRDLEDECGRGLSAMVGALEGS